MKNQDIRNAAADEGVKLWQIAEKPGISDSNFSRKLRKELSQGEKDRIGIIILELKREVG